MPELLIPKGLPLADEGKVIVGHAVVVIVGATGDVCFPNEKPPELDGTVDGEPEPKLYPGFVALPLTSSTEDEVVDGV